MNKVISLQQAPLWFPRSCVGIHKELKFTHPMHSYAEMWERGKVLHYTAVNNITATLSARKSNAQPWWLSFVSTVLSTIDECVISAYSYITTHPLQGYSFNCCSGRKDRLFGGFFICGKRKIP